MKLRAQQSTLFILCATILSCCSASASAPWRIEDFCPANRSASHPAIEDDLGTMGGGSLDFYGFPEINYDLRLYGGVIAYYHDRVVKLPFSRGHVYPGGGHESARIDAAALVQRADSEVDISLHFADLPLKFAWVWRIERTALDEKVCK